MRLRRMVFIAALLLSISRTQSAPPADPATDWLLSQATTQPATQPTSQATAEPLVAKKLGDDAGLVATIAFSDGSTLTGTVTTTPGKPIRVWDAEAKEYRDIQLSQIRSAESSVVWERNDPEWRFVEGGSDIKEKSGRTYPSRELTWSLTLADGSKLTGDIAAPLYLQQSDGSSRTVVLHKRDKGDAGQTLGQLVFVKRVDLRP